MRKILLFGFIMIGVMFYLSGICYGVPAARVIHELTQPDGTVIHARQWGDEWLHGWETENGYTIVRDKISGSWVYADKDAQGRLVTTNLIPNIHSPEKLRKHLRPSNKIL
jgi:hypothetical protein